MKIFTITCHDVYNHGASLQAYALMKYLQLTNNEVTIINYKPYYLDNKYKITAINNPYYNKNIILKYIYILMKFPQRIFLLKGKKKFDRFTREYLRITEEKYTSNDELKKKLNEADIYIAGSDQIWNSLFENGRDPAFYLDFAPKESKKVSYAASFATDKVSEEYFNIIKERLKRLDYISVRETSALNILNKMGIKNGVQVLDPVFLLSEDEWNSMCTNKICKEKYIFVYDFDNSILVEKIAKQLANKYKMKIYTVYKCNYSDRNITNIGPIEFLTYIRNCEYVISNSFHATAFAIIFKKQFYVINRKEKINTRMRDLVKLLGIENRLVSSVEKMDDNINYSQVTKVLNKEIIKSKSFLDSVLYK